MSTFFETLTVNDTYLASNKRPRQRITRACDKCHELRTRCNGEKPCNRCNELSVNCAYDRRPRKRGKGSWRRSGSPPQLESRGGTEQVEQRTPGAPEERQCTQSPQETDQGSSSLRLVRQCSSTLSGSVSTPEAQAYDQSDFDTRSSSNVAHVELQNRTLPGLDRREFAMSGDNQPGPSGASMLQSTNAFRLPHHRVSNELDYHTIPGAGNMSAFGGGMPSPHGSETFENFLQGTAFPSATSFSRNGLPWQANQSPRPFNFDSDHGSGSLIAADMKMKYAVLSPLMPHLINVISLTLANDLLEYYFTTFSGSSTHPLSPYIQTFILRKNSVLHPSNPRRCSPALLCSMLWLAAQTCEAPALTDGPTSRVRITHKLLELTLDLLQPLRHQPESGSKQAGDGRDDETTREFLHVSPNGNVPRTIEAKNFARSGSIDNIITYIHLGTVFSASEHKATSIRWWSVAWSMARDMKLNKEVPYPDVSKNDEEMQMGNPVDQHSGIPPRTEPTEEEREERRRVWWLLYMCDRHLSLCYNQPLFLTDTECETLLQPLDERIWRHARYDELEQILRSSNGRPRGPPTVCHNFSLFGYFLPVMTILGAIVDLRIAKEHPRFGQYTRANPFWDELAADISRQLDDYRYSLDQLGGSHAAVETAEDALHQRIAVAYGTHMMHVMHILLNGKWDPINLLDDEDHWVSSAEFRKATKHATSAAEVIPSIFDNDLDLSFMPWYWGIYLLQGSFLLLFVADKLQTQLAPSVLSALQSIVRAHEACAVTLDNEYQRNFRKIMISAVGQIKGRIAEDSFHLQQKRRETLSLYRWNGGGGGLAL